LGGHCLAALLVGLVRVLGLLV
jgi:hypothetical protein